ncbi:NADP-dependent oxidoreductase [Flavobacterium jejuense]|uniref:NADP-dependent oxidoreductase n=1 Tax=Flavobacterium jejuense TaxID=1544455 RepID=A0ABX0IR48_9FLAO|nr:NADP-dependent oxidoreductase [Flavobacterium jejuense]NHN25264.1 NADP-dependent oxidoreductase [Flavobacterium jejuense]
MKAIRIDEFGGTEVLKLVNIDRPIPENDEILVKVYSSSVNPVDCTMRNGGNEILRPFLKLPMILGCDVAGIVEEVGSEVTNFKKGDAVYGCPNFPGDGSYAEFVAAKSNRFAIKPSNISFNHAAAVPLTSLVAWEGIFELGKLEKGQKILIQGASGGVGSFAVQIAKAKGAYVIGVASTDNVEYLKQLGCDEVFDYKSQDFENILKNIDLVFDASPIRNDIDRLKSVKVLKNGGIFVSVNVDYPFSEIVNEEMDNKNVIGKMVAGQNHANLSEIAELISENKVNVFVSKVFPLEQVAEAHKESETWHVRGKLVLEVRKEI